MEMNRTMTAEQIYDDAVKDVTVALRKMNGGSLAANKRQAMIVVEAVLGVVLRNADTFDDGRCLAISTTELAAMLARQNNA